MTYQVFTKEIFALSIIIAIAGSLSAQSSHKLLREGDKAYKKEQFDKSEEAYRKAVDKEVSAQGTFNLGNAIYQQGRYEEAVQHYTNSSERANEDEKAQALYNLGNAQVQAGQLEEAIASYKEAVDYAPEDMDIRSNLYLAKLMRREEQQQEQQQQEQQQDNQENQDQESQDQQEQQQQQEGQQDDQQNQEQSSDTPIDNENPESSSEPQTQEMSREDAEKLLKVIENEEKSVQEKLRKVSGNKKKPAKDW